MPRQFQLLNLLHGLGGKVDLLDFQKLLFLYCQELEDDSPYDFVPYRWGAFSFTSYADRRKLVDRGFLVRDDSMWQLTADGVQASSRPRDANVSSFVRRYRNLRGDRLVANAYTRFPYYAINSESAERILEGDNEALRRIDAARPPTNPHALSTIGYEGRPIEKYLNQLIQAGVTLLCDVRRNAISRKYGFSKSTLANACTRVGIRYEHLPELGISTDRRRAISTAADLLRLLREYQRDDLPKQSRALATILQWARGGEHVALTCYEGDPKSCHRGRVAAEIERRGELGVSAKHLR